MREFKAKPLATVALLLGGWTMIGDVQSLLALGDLDVIPLPRVLADIFLLYFAGRVLKPKASDAPDTRFS